MTRNKTFTILSVIGMILILLGHMDLQVLNPAGLFPYYSYHVMIFVFISGYFYKPEDESRPGAYFLHKCKRLLLPYFCFNLIYGLISTLLNRAGFSIGEDISIYNLFVAPFVGGHQFGLNAPAWFVPALFMLLVCNICARKLLGIVTEKLPFTKEKTVQYTEWFLMLIYLAAGILAVALAIRGSVYDLYKIPGRLMLMAPALQLGRLYRARLENIDRIPSIIYFPVLILINLILTLKYVGLGYSTVWVTGFGAGPIVPFVTMVTGIALWLRVAKILASSLHEGGSTYKALNCIGSHTFDIMLHHLGVFMIINALIYALNRLTGVFADFDVAAFRSDIYYVFVPDGIEGFKFIYLMCGLVLPVCLGCLISKVRMKACGGRS